MHLLKREVYVMGEANVVELADRLPRTLEVKDATSRSACTQLASAPTHDPVPHWSTPDRQIEVVRNLPDDYRPPPDALVIFADILLRVAGEQKDVARA